MSRGYIAVSASHKITAIMHRPIHFIFDAALAFMRARFDFTAEPGPIDRMTLI
jgi:hypothetical protein